MGDGLCRPPQHASLPEHDKDRIAQSMRLAEQLGGETVTLLGEDVATEVLAYALERNCSQLVVGRPCRGIVEAHGGAIKAEPGRNGCGTCIVLWLPIGEAPDIAQIVAENE